MFTEISWATYWIVVAIAAIVYYLFVGFKYYFVEAKAILSKNLKSRTQEQHEILSGHTTKFSATENMSEENMQDDNFHLVEELTEGLIRIIRSASKINYPKQEFLQHLRLILHEYPSIKNSPVKSFINELIVTECNKYHSITLTNEEAELLWMDGV